MRIALIGCTANPRAGGMGRALYDHAVALAETGQEVVVYTLDTPHPNLLPQGEKGLRIVRLQSLVHIGKAAWGARFDPPLDHYDVVHLHLPFFGVAERVARDDKKARRLFVTYHMDAIGTGLKRVYFNWWYRHRFKKVLDACDAIAVTSRAYARDSWLARSGVDVEKCEEILLRVDTEKFTPHPDPGPALARPVQGTPLPKGEREPYFLFVGALDRAHYFKGLSVLLRVFRSLDPRFRGDDRGETASGMTELPRLVIVGAGELLEHYKKEVAAFGIEDRVQFTGGVSDEELARWYAGARALVLPSTDRSEAFGIVLIEAMACGTPVIASDLPGVRAVVERVAGGVLVIPSPWPSPLGGEGNLNADLASALRQMWQHPWNDNERAALAVRAAAIYGRATLADQLLKWYNQTHVPSR